LYPFKATLNSKANTIGKPLFETIMQLIINGETYDKLKADINVRDLLSHLDLPQAKIAVELNREIVPKSGYATMLLQDGDVLEIITFIGGG
jgi:thiamine biosynthesis protein ThiS